MNMIGAHKPYNDMDGKYGEVAVDAVRNWLRKNGYEITVLPHGKFKWDCRATSDLEDFFVEVERRRCWHKGWPYKSVHVPERRKRSGDAILFVVRDDLVQAMVVFYRHFIPELLKEVPNKKVATGEYFFDIPLEWTLRIHLDDYSLKSIAMRNKEYIKRQLDDYEQWPATCGMRASNLLGPIEPYGMDVGEWTELKVKYNNYEIQAMQSRPINKSLF